jgi:lysyl-tRNA synthetase class 2
MPIDWRPSAPLAILKLRAELLAEIRRFFADRSVLEVETPALSRGGATDPNIHSVTCALAESGVFRPLYLHTSPEFSMKRLLAAGSGDIYQIARVFREGERGRFHNPEFTLLEWYRVGYDHHALMDEVEALLWRLLACGTAERLSYAEAFMRYAGFDPHSATLEELSNVAEASGYRVSARAARPRDELLDLILSHNVQPRLGERAPTFLYEYPESQAALARVRPGHPAVAERFEVFVNGIELANGFHELRDPAEQARRFAEDLACRALMGLASIPIDEALIAGLRHGLPDCTGVALGFDRLVMIRSGARHIDEVLAFPFERA